MYYDDDDDDDYEDDYDDDYEDEDEDENGKCTCGAVNSDRVAG